MPGPEDPAPAPASSAPEDHGLPALSPDIIEQEDGAQLDNIVPTRGYAMNPVIGLGGSAGGLAALQTFFAHTPADTGFAFVVIMHLSAEHESILAELLQRSTPMPVGQVHGRTRVEPDHVYVIPPAKHLSMDDGHLLLSEPARRPGKHVAVDLFFRTLADACGPHAAAIVLSGADGDGAIGIKRIKERGGLTIAQEPREAEHDSMPRSAIATSMVDWILPVAEMPARLLAYWHTERRLALPGEDGPQPALEPPPALDTPGERALHDILGFLRVRTGRDFTYYKRATILRRVGRRMQVNEITDPGDYLAFMRSHPGEAGALLLDLLISVTNFFRDRDSFAALEAEIPRLFHGKVRADFRDVLPPDLEAEIPRLFHGKGPQDTVRVWVAACATGEEAYSIAMLLREHADTLDAPPRLQIFATDLDESAIQTAREGLYTETITADVSEERLRRFFVHEHGGYRIKREMRETVLFALHDLLKDSPFSRLDLVSCRNLLIYLNRDAQRRALDIFHFSLHAGGRLFLGPSESVDDADPLFAVTDRKHRLFTRRALTRARMPGFSGPSTLARAVLQRAVESQALPPVKALIVRHTSGTAVAEPHASWIELHFRLMERFGPPSVVVNRDYDVVHLAGSAGRFLQFDNGEPTSNLLRLVHPMLRLELRAALFQAAQAGVPMETRRVPLARDGQRLEVDLRVAPAGELAPDYFLVMFEAREAAAEPDLALRLEAEPEPAVRQLEREMEQARAQLRDTVEQADASEEELKASNEELQAMNEELRSATEELETGREELQSINEELSTVNQELKGKVDELGRSNSDLQNLMAATQIATVFLDRDLCIQRYTPPAVALFNLIPTDLGRPLSDLTPRLDYPALNADAARVLADLAVIELEVPHADGRWFLARMLPYRTTSDHIGGVVMTFVDITRRKGSETALAESQRQREQQRRILDTTLSAITDFAYVFDRTGRFAYTNRALSELLGLPHDLLIGKRLAELAAYSPAQAERFNSEIQRVFDTGESLLAETPFTSLAGRVSIHEYIFVPVYSADGASVEFVAGSSRDITAHKKTEAELTASRARLRLILENAREFAILSLDREGRITSWNAGAARLLGHAEHEILGQPADVIFTPEDRAAGGPQAEMGGALADGRATDERWHLRRDGSRFWGSGAMMRMDDADGHAIGFVKIMRDETEARETRQALEQGREDLWNALKATEAARAEAEAAAQAKDHFLAVLSHELRTPLTPVLMAVRLLRRDPALSAPARDALAMIERNVQIEARFIDDLLDVTRIARGKLELVREPLDLHEAIRRAVEITAGDFEAKNQWLTVDLAEGAAPMLGDSSRLQQIFWNLLSNASKFTPEGGAVRLSSRREPGRLAVEVSDTGIGFAPDEAGRLFEAFAQASVEVTREFGGLGLGLAISKAAVDAHGGVLRAESQGKGQGATFTVELPLAEGIRDEG